MNLINNGFRRDVVDLVVSNNCRSVVEVGVWRGELSRLLYKIVDELILVDPWRVENNVFVHEGEPYLCTMGESKLLNQKELDTVVYKIRQELPRARILRMGSIEASQLISNNSVDLVFIDAIHTYDHCKQDILAWLPKIKPGGMISGDDYCPTNNPRDVARAVKELLGVPNTVTPSSKVWFRVVNRPIKSSP